MILDITLFALMSTRYKYKYIQSDLEIDLHDEENSQPKNL